MNMRLFGTYVALGTCVASTCVAQTSVTTIDMGDGMSISTDNQGRSATTIDLGGGMSTTTVQPGFGQPSVPIYGRPGGYGPGPAPLILPQPVYR